jgi:ribokinase
VVDTTAAGDTFTGYFLAGMLMNQPIPDVLRDASAASALAVSRQGAAPSIPYRTEVEDFLKSLEA